MINGSVGKAGGGDMAKGEGKVGGGGKAGCGKDV